MATMGVYLAGFLAVAASWLIYYFVHFHRLTNPLVFHELADSTVMLRMPWMEYRSYSWRIFLEPGFFGALTKKFAVYLFRSTTDLFTLWFQYIFFAIYLLALFKKTSPRFTLARFAALLLGWQLVAFAFLRYENMGFLNGRYFLWFAPFVLLGALDFLDKRSDQPARRWTMLSGVCAAQLALWILVFTHLPSRRSDHPSGLDVPAWEEIAYVRDHTQSDDWIITNIPTQITWYAKRPTINIPNTLEDFRRLTERYAVPFVYLSTHRIGELENYPEWQWVQRNPAAYPRELADTGYVVERVFPAGILYRKQPSSL